MKKPLPMIANDQEAEAFVETSDLTDHDLFGMTIAPFDFQPKDEWGKCACPRHCWPPCRPTMVHDHRI